MRPRVLVVPLLAAGSVACSAILGIEEGEPRSSEMSSDGGTTSDAVADGGLAGDASDARTDGGADAAATVAVLTTAGELLIRYSNTAGPADETLPTGAPADASPIAGRWSGASWLVGWYDATSNEMTLRLDRTETGPTKTFTITGVPQPEAGAPRLVPVAGDWDGDGVTTTGLFDPISSRFYLRNQNETGLFDISFQLGVGGAELQPLAGDWDGDGKDSAGIVVPNGARTAVFLKNALENGAADIGLEIQAPSIGFRALGFDWNGDRKAEFAIFDRDSSTFILYDLAGAERSRFVFPTAATGGRAVAGRWR